MPRDAIRVSVFGLGYVGTVTAACLAQNGLDVVGVDIDPRKLALLEAGRSPVVEPGLEEIIGSTVASGRLTFTTDAALAVRQTDLSIVAVGTPSDEEGEVDTRQVERVCEQIGSGLADKPGRHTVVIRSTVLPGTTERLLIPVLEKASGGTVGVDFDIVFNPEFMREGESIHDFYHPPFTVLGSHGSADLDALRPLFSEVSGNVITCSIPVAEAVKYGSNILHATKITFANELAVMCNAIGIDAREVLDIVVADTKLNISSKYMRPGLPFGGSCLPKDLRAFATSARKINAPLTMFEAIMTSNHLQTERIARRVLTAGSRRVALFGLSFKEGTDDLRESPLVALAEMLIGESIDLKIVDPNVEYSALLGANRSFLDTELPNFEERLSTSGEALATCDTLVFAHDSTYFRQALEQVGPHHHVIDLVGLDDVDHAAGTYEGLYW